MARSIYVNGQHGPVQLSRAAATALQMPAAQGFIGTGGVDFQPANRAVFTVGGHIIGLPAVVSYGPQFAPGQGADTPGGGGSCEGTTMAVETRWLTNGRVVPASQLAHQPGTVGWVGSRRSRA